MRRRHAFLLVVPWDAAMIDRLRALDNLPPATGRTDPVALVLLSREFPIRSRGAGSAGGRGGRLRGRGGAVMAPGVTIAAAMTRQPTRREGLPPDRQVLAGSSPAGGGSPRVPPSGAGESPEGPRSSDEAAAGDDAAVYVNSILWPRTAWEWCESGIRLRPDLLAADHPAKVLWEASKAEQPQGWRGLTLSYVG